MVWHLQAFPSWQILLLDLRCHGESAWHPRRPSGPHSVDSAAGDVLRLLGRLKLFPELLIGHSFGGKVVMSMADQFGRRGSRLPRPVKVRGPVLEAPLPLLLDMIYPS